MILSVILKNIFSVNYCKKKQKTKQKTKQNKTETFLSIHYFY